MDDTPRLPIRYLVFAGQNYYPGGGADDFVGSFTTLEAARVAWAQQKAVRDAWAEIVTFDGVDMVELWP